ncbi:NADP-dependent oxidoreductase [Microbacterium sp. ZW T5_56]|uniref:NADP-dependent oxidoreductase n=1 Tax=Microbacterium sp. ZW T5_56 TaxID=3378081 RepID=UPI003851C5E5
MSNRTVWQTAFGGPENIEIVDADVPTPGPEEVRVRVAAAGLNPVDWKVAASEQMARAFHVSVPGGYGSDFAGVIDAVGDRVGSWSVGDRVLGAARGHAIADYIVAPVSKLVPVPETVSLQTAATLDIAGRTAAAAVDALHLTADDAVLIGGAAGGVGVIAVQLAVATGAQVIATASERNHDFLRQLGAVAVAYGPGLADRVRAAADRSVTAATDLQGTEAIDAAIELGVSPERITAIAAGGASLPAGVTATGGGNARPDALADIQRRIGDGSLRIEIAEAYPLEETAAAVERLREGHVRGKLVIAVDPTLV